MQVNNFKLLATSRTSMIDSEKPLAITHPQTRAIRTKLAVLLTVSRLCEHALAPSVLKN